MQGIKFGCMLWCSEWKNERGHHTNAIEHHWRRVWLMAKQRWVHLPHVVAMWDQCLTTLLVNFEIQGKQKARALLQAMAQGDE